ncbi:hypothetical protein [Streptomyces sp. Y7]|uniref:hypothetical protein n=1 Tax=Streptomyces sp. Y7 TaxID=3342392 RepID=UPI0037107E97
MAESFMQQLITSLARRTPVLDESPPSQSGPSDTITQAHRPAKSHLLAEDRPDFERTLDEVLTAEATGHPTARLSAEQLRTMALAASGLIAATAASEYAQYVEVRERVKDTQGSGAPLTDDQPDRRPGTSLMAVLAVLTPVLFGVAAVIFLLVGYALGMTSPKPAVASTLLTAGWSFAAATAASLMSAMIGLLLSALRHRAAYEEWVGNEDVAEAREAWRQALRRRGIEPFLREVRNAVSRSLDQDEDL